MVSHNSAPALLLAQDCRSWAAGGHRGAAVICRAACWNEVLPPFLSLALTSEQRSQSPTMALYLDH